MNDALSIFAAADETPHAIGFVIGDQQFTFAHLAALTRERLRALPAAVDRSRPQTLIASNTLQTVVSVYALLEARVPALLLHPRLTATEAQTRRAIAADARIAASDAAAVLFTSGTTGAPRAAVLTRTALLASAQASAANLGWHHDDRWLLAMSIARIGGLSILTRCLAARRTAVMAPAFDATQLPRLVDEQRITLASLVPTMLAQVFNAHPGWRPPAFLRAVLVGGAAASAALLQRAAQRRLPVVITYGCTESCSQVAATPYEGRFDAARYGAGRPLPGAEIRILDGRIQLRGPMRMAGYLGKPLLPDDVWFDTGDLGELDAEGCLHVIGRGCDLIVSGGENVAPAEVERILESFPGVVAAGVFGVADETWGEIVAAALVVQSERFDEAALSRHLDAQLSPYKQPRRICYVAALPQTTAGKLDRVGLTAYAAMLGSLVRSA